MVKNVFFLKQFVGFFLLYCKMKNVFFKDEMVDKVNIDFKGFKGKIFGKEILVLFDNLVWGNWEMGIMLYFDDIFIILVGKGEQNSVKIRLVMDVVVIVYVFFIEELENYLFFSNLNIFIEVIFVVYKDCQIIIIIYSSFVVNKLGIEFVIFFY